MADQSALTVVWEEAPLKNEGTQAMRMFDSGFVRNPRHSQSATLRLSRNDSTRRSFDAPANQRQEGQAVSLGSNLTRPIN